MDEIEEVREGGRGLVLSLCLYKRSEGSSKLPMWICFFFSFLLKLLRVMFLKVSSLMMERVGAFFIFCLVWFDWFGLVWLVGLVLG